jgi:hypothetical protein
MATVDEKIDLMKIFMPVALPARHLLFDLQVPEEEQKKSSHEVSL